MLKRFYWFALGTGLFFTVADAQQAQLYSLTSEDHAVVEKFVADETAMPERARVTGVAAAVTSQGVISVCGYVKWINSSGLYGPYRPFQGVLATNKEGHRVFAVVSIARDSRDHEIIEMLCAEGGSPITPGSMPAVATPSAHVAKLIDAARELNRRCRGTEGANPSSTVCEERNSAFDAVNAVGWCFGRSNEAGYQHEWHACGPDSIGR